MKVLDHQGCTGSVDSRSVAFFLESRVVSNFTYESQSRSKSRSKKSMGRKVRVATDRLRPTFCKNSLQNKTFILFLFTNFCSDISLEPWKNIRKCEIWKKIRITKKARAKRPYKLMLLEFFWRLCWSAAGGAAGVLLEALLDLFWSSSGVSKNS